MLFGNSLGLIMSKTLADYFLMLRDRSTLGQQVAVVTAALCLVLIFALAATAAFVGRQQSAERAEAEIIGLASNMAERLDARMFERFREVRNLAALEPLADIWASEPERIRPVLQQLQDSLPEYAWIGFAQPDGTVKAATNGMLEGVSVAQRPWFIDGLKGAAVKDVHDAKLLAEMLGPQANGEPFRFVDVAVPVKNAAGEVIGVLGAHMSWTWADDVRKTVLATVEASSTTDILVLRSDGTALLGASYGTMPFNAAAVRAIQGSGRQSFVDTEGTANHLAAAVATTGHLDYPGLGWTVVARRPLDIAMAPANRLAEVIMLIGLVFAAIGAAAAGLLARSVTQPLAELAQGIDSIGRDSGATMISRDHSSRDVSHLSMSIRSLLRRLGTAETAHEAAQREALLSKELLAEKTMRMGEDMHALQVLADTDPLTGLLNRRAFRVFGSDAMNYFKRHKRDLGVLVIDIDFFKRVNDTYGHSVGDDVIRMVGESVLGEARNIDKVARFGGEEFVVLLRETESEGPAILAERIRQKIGSALIKHPEHGALHVTVSIGGAMAAVGDRDIEDVIQRADRALYEAKASGRNCVVVAGSAVQPGRLAA
jgi:diguanylate cyclase (GGDEF)-like protein